MVTITELGLDSCARRFIAGSSDRVFRQRRHLDGSISIFHGRFPIAETAIDRCQHVVQIGVIGLVLQQRLESVARLSVIGFGYAGIARQPAYITETNIESAEGPIRRSTSP